MYFNSSQNPRTTIDPRRSADEGLDPESFEPDIQQSTGKLFRSVPKKIASFDLETTGFGSPDPISFGLAIFRHGKLSETESQHFLIEPKKPIQEGAFETHGWTDDDLRLHRFGYAPSTEPKAFTSSEIIVPMNELENMQKDFARRERRKSFEDRYDVSSATGPNGQQMASIKRKILAPPLTQEDIDLAPALPLGIGINKIVNTMSNLQKQGFVFVGANPTYDTQVIQGVWQDHNAGMPIQLTGFNPNTMRLVDIIKHDHSIESKEVNPRSRALSALAKYYGIEAGGHRALQDSISAGRVFIEGQIPAAQKIPIKSASKKINLSSADASALGINWGLGGPCFGDSCGFCDHLNEVAMSHADPAKSGKVNSIMQMHQGM